MAPCSESVHLWHDTAPKCECGAVGFPSWSIEGPARFIQGIREDFEVWKKAKILRPGVEWAIQTLLSRINELERGQG